VAEHTAFHPAAEGSSLVTISGAGREGIREKFCSRLKVSIFFQLYVLAVISVPSMRRIMLERNSKYKHNDKIDILARKAQVSKSAKTFSFSVTDIPGKTS
jgi:hypothetical protein